MIFFQGNHGVERGEKPPGQQSQKTTENHHFLWENYGKSLFLMGKLWKITIFNGKTMENHYF